MTRKFRKVLALGSAFAILVTALAGCGSKAGETAAGTPAAATLAEAATQETTKAPETAKTEKIKLTFLDWESTEMNKAIQASFDEFQKENPNVEVKLNPAPLKDYGIKIQQMVAAGEAPDTFMVGNDMAIKYGSEGLLLELNKYTDSDQGFLDGFYPGVLQSWQIDGKMVGLPGLLNTYGVFYNKKYFTEKNIALPTKDWTYQQMMDAAEKFKDPAKKIYGLYNATPDVYKMGVYAAAAGGLGFCDAIYPVTKVQASAEFKEGVALFSEKIKSGALPPATYNVDNLIGLFMQGNVPMMWYGQWGADQLIREAPKELEWGFAPNPMVKQQSTIYDAVGWVVPKATKYPDESYKLLKYIVTKTYEKVLPQFPVAPTAYVGSAKPYYDKLKELGRTDVAESIDYMLNSPNKQPVRIFQSFGDKAGKFTDAYWYNILEGKQPITKLDEMVKSINDVIAASSK